MGGRNGSVVDRQLVWAATPQEAAGSGVSSQMSVRAAYSHFSNHLKAASPHPPEIDSCRVQHNLQHITSYRSSQGQVTLQISSTIGLCICIFTACTCKCASYTFGDHDDDIILQEINPKKENYSIQEVEKHEINLILLGWRRMRKPTANG